MADHAFVVYVVSKFFRMDEAGNMTGVNIDLVNDWSSHYGSVSTTHAYTAVANALRFAMKQAASLPEEKIAEEWKKDQLAAAYIQGMTDAGVMIRHAGAALNGDVCVHIEAKLPAVADSAMALLARTRATTNDNDSDV